MALTLLFGAGIFVPSLTGVNMMDRGFAAAVFSGFLALIALITAVIYARQARLLNRLFAGDQLLAVWTFTPEHWRQAVESDWQEEVTNKRRLWYIVVGWCVLIGGGFWLIDPEAGGVVALILAAVAGICGVAAVAAPRWRRRRQLSEPPAAWIGLRGAFVGGLFHDWSLPGSALTDVQTVEDEQGNRSLHLTYRFVAGHGAGFQYETSRIPVPPGRESEAQEVAARLDASIR